MQLEESRYKQCNSAAVILVVCRMDFIFLFQISFLFFSQVPVVKQLASALHILLPATWFVVFLYKICTAIVWKWSSPTETANPLKEFEDTVSIILLECNFDFFFFEQNVILEVS